MSLAMRSKQLFLVEDEYVDLHMSTIDEGDEEEGKKASSSSRSSAVAPAVIKSCQRLEKRNSYTCSFRSMMHKQIQTDEVVTSVYLTGQNTRLSTK
jgi:hypothetical protein